MPLPSSASVRGRLTQHYVLALALLAVLAFSGQLLIQTALRPQVSEAREVNLAGRQRMLSQRIAKHAIAAAADLNRAESLRHLHQDVASFTATHIALLEGDAIRGLSGLRATPVRDSLDALTADVDVIAAAAAALGAALNRPEDVPASDLDAVLAHLLAAEAAFLPAMDRVVFALDENAQASTRWIRLVQLGQFVLTLLVLTLEGLFIFRPAVRSVSNALALLTQQHTMLRTIVDTVPDHIYVKDRSGRAVLRNTASASAFPGLAPEDTLGVTDAELNQSTAADIGEVTLSDDLRVIETGVPLIDHEEVTPDGAWLLTTKVPLVDETGRVTHLVGVSRDVTTIKLASDELVRAKKEAEQAARMKSAFLANMSHEIRTPLNGVLGMAELLRSGSLGPEEREYADLISTSGMTLLRLLNDLLDFSKIEAGRIDIEARPFDVHRTVRDATRLLSPKAKDHAIDLSVEVVPGTPAHAVGDAHRVQQVVLNLVSNAIKFTREGRVSVRLSASVPDPLPPDSVPLDAAEGEAPQNRAHASALIHYTVTVEDTGIGIAPEKLKAIFDPFTQADVSTTRRYGGTGLGLAISRRLAALLGGKIQAESVERQGSTFRFTFVAQAQVPTIQQTQMPVTQTLAMGPQPDAPLLASSTAERAPSADPTSLRVLLVEDEESNQFVAQTMLTWLGHDTTVADDGQVALDALAQDRFDVVLIDLHMPSLDGLAATRQLRARSGAQPYVIALTADASVSAEAACRVAGMDAYLAKPVRMDVLAATLAEVVPRRAGPTEHGRSVLASA